MKILIFYLILINAAGFLFMLVDKFKARKNLWRIPEATLLGIAAVGGSLGCMLGMYTARHKTKHLKFALGLPAIFAAQIVIAVLLLPRSL